MADARVRRTLVAVGWVGAVVATTLNGILVGYGAIWLQFFGETADAEDYRVSAGGYGAAAAVLVLAVPAILTHRAPRWLVWPTGVAAGVLALLAVNSIAASVHAEPVPSPINTVWDGIGGVLWAPWTWALIGLGIHGLYRFACPDGIRPGSRR